MLILIGVAGRRGALQDVMEMLRSRFLGFAHRVLLELCHESYIFDSGRGDRLEMKSH
jgi:hypothetical protein